MALPYFFGALFVGIISIVVYGITRPRPIAYHNSSYSSRSIPPTYSYNTQRTEQPARQQNNIQRKTQRATTPPPKKRLLTCDQCKGVLVKFEERRSFANCKHLFHKNCFNFNCYECPSCDVE